MKTNELTGALLDYWVARAEGVPAAQLTIRSGHRAELDTCSVEPPTNAFRFGLGTFAPSTDWAQGGPIIERESITTHKVLNEWSAWLRLSDYTATATTPLVAAMRAYVASRFGDEVQDVEGVA